MLASITPLGERGRRSTWAVTVAAFALGATAAGVAAGALVGALGTVVPVGAHGRLVVGVGALAAAVAIDALARPVPGPRRQVNERWLDEYRGWVYGGGYGAQLGVGLATVVSSAATYAAFACAFVAGPSGGAVITGCYGAVRGLTPLAAAGVRTPARLIAIHRGLDRWRGPVKWGSSVALCLVAVAGMLA
jgi:hypothetical protein